MRVGRIPENKPGARARGVHSPRSRFGLVMLFTLWGGAAATRAEAPPAIFPSESKPTASRLADARKLIEEKKSKNPNIGKIIQKIRD